MSDRSTDKGIAEGIRAGEESALRTLFEIYAEPLLDFAFGFIGDESASEDVVQEVFINVWRNRIRLNPELSLRAYLYKAVRNQALKVLRHAKVERGATEYLQSLYYSTDNPDEEYHHAELTVLLDRTIQELPERCRTVFLMSKFDGLSYQEIADVLDISINTVKTQMGRAFTTIRRNLLPKQ
jgi:RNA polymerase sigma-70 factor (ECF subfamily)